MNFLNNCRINEIYMFLSHGQVQTSETIENVFNQIQYSIEEVGANIESIDRSNYQITGKSWIKKRSIVPWKFYVVLRGNLNGTNIEIYDEHCGVWGPNKDLNCFIL